MLLKCTSKAVLDVIKHFFSPQMTMYFKHTLSHVKENASMIGFNPRFSLLASVLRSSLINILFI